MQQNVRYCNDKPSCIEGAKRVNFFQERSSSMDFKDRMIEAVEGGECDDDEAYDHVRESLAEDADHQCKAAREAGPDAEDH